MLAVIVAIAVVLPGALAQGAEPVAVAVFPLDEMLARGPAVLVFWNSWLPGAAEFAPLVAEIDGVAAELALPGAVVVFQDEGDAWRQGIASSGSALPRVLDRRGELLRRFKVTRAPTVLLVGRRGEVIERAGPDTSQVRALLRELAARSAR